MKTVLITGSSRGIGAETARIFAQNGYNVVINYNKSEEEALSLKKELEEKYKIEALVIEANIASEEDVKNMIQSSLKAFKKINILVNNAGIAIDNTFELKTRAEFIQVLNTNLVGTFLMCKYVSALEGLEAIINVSSNAGIDQFYSEGMDYNASKAGIISLTKDLAEYLAPIRVNAVAPGWINTDMNKNLDKKFVSKEKKKIFLKRFGNPSEVAKVIYFLASKEASYINGEIIRVDGGVHHA